MTCAYDFMTFFVDSGPLQVCRGNLLLADRFKDRIFKSASDLMKGPPHSLIAMK
jgi:hypothetical protein